MTDVDQGQKYQARAIMVELGETERKVLAQLYRVIEVLGIEVVQAVLEETRETEAQGGLLRKDGERRTMGGVFFALIRNRCSKEQYQRIFWPKPPRKATAAPLPPEPVPSEQALQIASIVVEKLKLSQKKQTAIARDVDRVGVPAAMQALRSALKVEQQGGRKDADGKRMKPLKVWQDAVNGVGKQVL